MNQQNEKVSRFIKAVQNLVVKGVDENVISQSGFPKLHEQVMGASGILCGQGKVHVDQIFSESAGEIFSE